MRIVQVNFAFDPGVASPDALLDRYGTLTGWSDALVAAGAQVRVVQRFSSDDVRSRGGVEYAFCSTYRRLAAAAASFQSDIVHVNGLEFPGHTWRLRRRLPPRAAIVVQAHSDPGAFGRAPLLRAVGRILRGSADACLVAADEHADGWRRIGLFAASQPAYQVMEASTRFHRMPRDAARRESGVDGRPAVLWVGRLNANKDPLTALDGFERALAALPGAALTMVYSTTELLPAVRARIESSVALRSRVRLVGEVPHDRLPAYFSAADMFLVGSHHEGSGYSLMEACACSAIPVVTDIPSFRAMLGAGFGALWKPGDADDCARALTRIALCDLDAERRRLADHFERAMSWEAVGKRAMEIYREVIALRAKG